MAGMKEACEKGLRIFMIGRFNSARFVIGKIEKDLEFAIITRENDGSLT